MLTDVLGRKITHTVLSEAELAEWLTSRGVPDYVSKMLAQMDIGIKGGMEERLNNTVREVTGKDPMTFREFAEKSKAAWV